MKKVLKSGLKLLFGIGVGFLLCGTAVYAQILIASTEVAYTPNDSLVKTTDTKGALDNLYARVNRFAEIPKFCQLVEGTLGQVGSKYSCDPGDGVERMFYILQVQNEYVIMLMDRNLPDSEMTYLDAARYFKTGDGVNLKNSWTNVLDVFSVDRSTIVNLALATYNVTSLNYGCLTNKGSSSKCSSTTNSSLGWLFEHLSGCKDYGCSDQSGDTATGYWLGDPAYYIYYVNNTSMVVGFAQSSTDYTDVMNGIRPSITVLKSNLYE